MSKNVETISQEFQDDIEKIYTEEVILNHTNTVRRLLDSCFHHGHIPFIAVRIPKSNMEMQVMFEPIKNFFTPNGVIVLSLDPNTLREYIQGDEGFSALFAFKGKTHTLTIPYKYILNVFCQEITAKNSISRIDIYAVAMGYIELVYNDEYPSITVNTEKQEDAKTEEKPHGAHLRIVK